MSCPKFDLTGKTILVTGGNGGIGLGMAKALAQAGADVCIWGRNEEKNKNALEMLRIYGTRVFAVRCDLSNENEVQLAFTKTLNELQKIDACFANAGIGTPGTRFHKMTSEEWHRIFGTNIDGVFYTFREVISHMIERGKGGSLVVTSSLSAISGMQRGEHYAATKAGLIAIIRGLSVEYARFGIRANAIIPGWIETEMTAPVFAWEKMASNVMSRIPLGRWGQPGDMGGIAVYLASDMSSYHTGDTLVIDGGYSSF